MIKNGKELKVTNFKNYNITLGSVNNKNSKSVYINISAWGEPQDSEIAYYTRIIRDINKKIKQSLFNKFDSEINTEIKKENTIVDLDIKESGIRYGKRSFMNCEITLFLNTELPVNSKYMKDKLDDVLDMVINTILEKNKFFKFHKKKN